MRDFPMQGGPAVPWSFAEEIYKVYAEVFPGSANQQSLERIAERGGFGWEEVKCLMQKRGGSGK